MQAGAAVIIFAVFVCMVIIALFRERPVFKASSPVFLLYMCVGIAMLCSSIFSRANESLGGLSSRTAACVSDLYLCNLGYFLIVGALLLKTYRLRAIFLRRSLTGKIAFLQDSRLALVLIGILMAETVMLLALEQSHRLTSVLDSIDNETVYWHCSTPSDTDLTGLYLPITIAFRFVLLALTAACVYSVREIPSQFNEATSLLATVYNLLFLSILLPIIDAVMDRGRDTALIAYSISVFAICVLTLLLQLAPKIIVLLGRGGGSSGLQNKTLAGTQLTMTGESDSNNTHGMGEKMSSAKSANAPAIPQAASPPVKRGSTIGNTPSSINVTNSQAPSAASIASTVKSSSVAPRAGDRTFAAGAITPAPAAPAALADVRVDVLTPRSPSVPSSPVLAVATGPPVSPRSAIRIHMNNEMAEDLVLVARHREQFKQFLAQQGASSADDV